MSSTCPACFSDRSTSFIGTERMYGWGEQFDYFECQDCHSIWIAKIPEDLGRFYPQDYYAFQEVREDSAIKKQVKRLRYQLFKKGWIQRGPEYFDWIKNLDLGEEDRIADIGCGAGIVLHQLAYSGFKNVYGFDPYIQQETHRQGLSIAKKSLDQIEGTFDVLMLHHSFEHLPDPNAAFDQLANLLIPGGKLLIRLPVTDGLIWKKDREFWFQLDAPRHLFIPSVKGMETLGSRHGLKLEKVIFDSTASQFWGTALYKENKNFVDFELNNQFSKAELKNLERKAKRLNKIQQGDQAAFYFNR